MKKNNSDVFNQPLMAKKMVEPQFVRSGQLSLVLGISPSALKRYRKEKVFKSGIHYFFRANTTTNIFWNLPLMRDWLVNGNSESHQRAIETYLKTLPSNGE